DSGGAMAHTFGKITVGAGGLRGKKANEYEATVLGRLHAFDVTQTGRAVLNWIRFHERVPLVCRYGWSEGFCNAVTKSEWGLFRIKGLFPTKVLFTPGLFFASGPCSQPNRAGDLPNEVLLHELVHAVRYLSGKFMKSRTDDEERIAVM